MPKGSRHTFDHLSWDQHPGCARQRAGGSRVDRFHCTRGERRWQDQAMELRDRIALAGVIASTLVSVVAIFGEEIRSSLFQPELRMDLVDPSGVSTTDLVVDNAGSQYQ